MMTLFKYKLYFLSLICLVHGSYGQAIEPKLTDEQISFHQSILNTTLIGVAMIDEKKNTNYNNFVVDFNSGCLCNSPSFYIDTDKNQFYAINFCAGEYSEDLEEDYLTTKIKRIEVDSVKLQVTVSSSEQSNLILTFTKIKPDIYKLVIDGELNRDYIGIQLYNYYIPINASQKVKKEDCGEFDG